MTINPEDFPGNSILKPEKKVSRVTKGTVHQRKKPILDRIFGGETAQGIVEYVLYEVLIPAAKSTISDIVSNTIEMALYGETGKRSSRLRRDRDVTHVSYNSIYDGRKSRSRSSSRRPRSRHRFDDIVIEKRVDAEEVLSTMVDQIDLYELVTVADFYEACGIQSEYTDQNYGWESLREASIRPVRGGYILDLPDPYPLD